MEKIPSSFMGYKKEIVEEIINKKDALLFTQRQDINYLRTEIDKLEKSLNEKSQNIKNNL